MMEMETNMKMSLFRIAAFLLACLMLPLFAFAEGTAVYALETRTFPLRQCLDDEKEPAESEMTLYFVNGGDIPYVKLSEYMVFLRRLFSDMGKGDIEFVITASEQLPHLFSVSRADNHSFMVLNTEEDSVILSGSNFLNDAGVTALVTVIDLPEPEEYDVAALLELAMEMKSSGQYTDDEIQAAVQRKDDDNGPKMFTPSGKSFNQFGKMAKIPLADYAVDLIAANGECYVPMQTLSDLLLSLQYINLVFTGEEILCAAYGTEFVSQMYSAAPQEMSPDFAQFNYNELMLLLDTYYGLKDEHRIVTFQDTVLYNTDLAPIIGNTDPKAFDSALASLLMTYLDDGHSGFIKSSWRSGEMDAVSMISLLTSFGRSSRTKLRTKSRFTEARKAFYPDRVPGYEEIGDTAFITFDSFSMKHEDLKDYYKLESIDPDEDTFQLISYANQQIRREDSPVKSIVLDLSLNGGGHADAAVFVISWFSKEAVLALRDTLTGSETITSYFADVNLDGKSQGDADDTVSGGDYHLYCLISGNSFSCGNLVPAAFKASGDVTLLGRRSGGGSCVVLPCTSASGSVFAISGPKQLATVLNGSFYNIDEGIEPDFVLSRPESFYDRPALVEYIHTLK